MSNPPSQSPSSLVIEGDYVGMTIGIFLCIFIACILIRLRYLSNKKSQYQIMEEQKKKEEEERGEKEDKVESGDREGDCRIGDTKDKFNIVEEKSSVEEGRGDVEEGEGNFLNIS